MEGDVLLDLDYLEDSRTEIDLNIVMTKEKNLIEILGTAEKGFLKRSQLDRMIDFAEVGVDAFVNAQKIALLSTIVGKPS